MGDWPTTLQFATYLDLPRGFALKQMFPVMGPATGGTLLRISPPPEELSRGCLHVCRFGERRVPDGDGVAAGAATPTPQARAVHREAHSAETRRDARRCAEMRRDVLRCAEMC